MYPTYYVVEGDTLPHLFDTFDGGTGASITMTGLAVTDIEVYKDGGTTQRASDSGYALLDTDGIDFDGTTGIHGFSLDLSDNSDAGFYAVGSWYHVVVASVTVDGQTVNFVACAFRIVSATRGLAGTALPAAAADAAGGLIISDAGGLDADAMATGAARALTALPNAAADGAGGLPISDAGGLDLDAQLAATNEVTAARMGALTDWIDGGRLDVLLDDVKAVTDALTSAAAAKLALSAGTLVSGTVDNSAHTPTTTEFEADDITEATADHYIGRTIIFLTGVLAGQATDIVDYALSGSNGHFTTSALTEAPGNDDTFLIV